MSLSPSISRIEGIIGRQRRAGYRASLVVSTLARLVGLEKSVEALARAASCYGSSRGSCTRSGQLTLCRTPCTEVYVLQGAGETVLWRIKGGAFKARISDGSLELSARKAWMAIRGEELSYSMQGGAGARNLRLSEEDEVYRASYELGYVLKRLSRPVDRTLHSLAMCIKRDRSPCWP